MIKVPRFQPRYVVSLCLISLAMAVSGSAQSINWGNGVIDVNIDSAGDGLSSATFTFQLGVFSNGGGPPATEFVPTTMNTDFWGSKWVALDTASYNEGSGSQGFFSDSWKVADDTYAGFQGYIWVYNNQVGDETSEWVLLTDDFGADAWKIPAHTGGQTALPLQWRVSTATVPVFGGLNSVDGPGETDPSAPTTFAIQTNTFLPVPESGTTLLFGLTLGLLVLGRRRTR